MGSWSREELHLFRDTVRKAARDKIAPRAEQMDRAAALDAEVIDLLWDLGLLTIMLPPEHGGAEHDKCQTLCVAVEEIAKVCASSALCVIVQAVGSFPILHGGSDEVLETWTPRLSATGRTLAAYLVTEPGAGSDVAGITTRAERRDDGGWTIHGVKQFATNGGLAGVASVLARTGPERHGDLHFFVVDSAAEGFTVGKKEDKLGQRLHVKR